MAPWKPAYAGQYLDKLEDARKAAADKIKAANTDKSASLSDRLKTVRGSQTAVGARWDQEAASRRKAQGLDENVVQEEEQHQQQYVPPSTHSTSASSYGRALPPSRAPAATGPPPQRTSASAAARTSNAAVPPAPPTRTDSTAASRPPLPARTSTLGSSHSHASPPPPPARSVAGRPQPPLPPRMNNESGTAHPPPPYNPTPAVGEATAALDNMTIASAPPPPPTRRGPPPIPAVRKPAPPAVPSNKPKVGSSTVSSPPQPPPAAPQSPPQAPPRPMATSSAAAPATLLPLSCSRHPSTEACKALTAATFFCYPTHYPEWSSPTPWFTSKGPGKIVSPPSLEGRRDLYTKYSMTSYGPNIKLQGALQFDDLSTLWYQISYTSSHIANFECKVAYAEPPSAWSEVSHAGLLLACAQGYGELVARKVEQWQGTVVGDGECWTLAAQALQEVNREQGYTEDLQLLESVGRTHGHLIYHASVDPSTGLASGIWRGGDVGQLRRGDIVEWATSSFNLGGGRSISLGAPEKGMPDHTAVIIDVTANGSAARNQNDRATASSSTLPSDQVSLAPRDLCASFTVLEQAAGQVVHTTSFPFGQRPEAWTSGALWIYRPVGKNSLLEGTVEPNAWQEDERQQQQKLQGRGEMQKRRRGWEPLN